MKKSILFLTAITLSIGLTAQIQESTQIAKSEAISNLAVTRSAGSPNGTASIDTIWSDDFSDTTHWQYVGGANEFAIQDTLSASLINQGFDSTLQSNSGGNFGFIDSDASGNTGTQDATLEYTGGVINCTGYPSVRLTFQTYLRQYKEIRQVLVSNDGGMIWDTINVLTEFGTGVTSPNGYTEVVDISFAAGNQANVSVKFRYEGAFDWFWTIDDVKIVTVPTNELRLTQEYYNSSTDATYSTFYDMIPIRQADSAMLNLGTEVQNAGAADQTNTFVKATVSYNGMEVYADTTDTTTLVSGVKAGFDFQNAFEPNHGFGLYEMEFEVVSDSTDEFPSNNMITNSFTVSNNQYRRDNGVLTTENWFDVNSQWEMLSRYEIFTTDTVVAVSVFFPNNPVSGRGLVAGDSISYYVYSATDLAAPLTENTGYIIQDADVNNWVMLPVPAVSLPKGLYYVGFKISNNTSSVGTNSELNAITPPLTVLIRTDATDATDPFQYTTSFTPFIRMFTISDSVCNGVNIVIEDTVHDQSTLGAVEIMVTGGTPSYTYAWTGPDSNFSATTQNIDSLISQGMYYVTVTDVFGCTGNDSSLVAGSVTTNNIELVNDLKIYPNPSNGLVQITGDIQVSGNYTFKVVNILGQTVYSETEFQDVQMTKTLNLSALKKGIYFVVIDFNGEKSKTRRLVIQ